LPQKLPKSPLNAHKPRCINCDCKLVALSGSYLAGVSGIWATAISLQEPMTLENRFRAHSTRIRLIAVAAVCDLPSPKRPTTLNAKLLGHLKSRSKCSVDACQASHFTDIIFAARRNPGSSSTRWMAAIAVNQTWSMNFVSDAIARPGAVSRRIKITQRGRFQRISWR
jgi:hypothetical protein